MKKNVILRGVGGIIFGGGIALIAQVFNPIAVFGIILSIIGMDIAWHYSK